MVARFIVQPYGQPGSTTPIALGGLGGTNSYASGINDSRQIVGGADTTANGCCNTVHAVLWQPGKAAPTDLGTLGGVDSIANAINTSGQVTGTAQVAGDSYHTFITNSVGKLIDLGNGAGYGINSSGQVVGVSNSNAALWQAGSTTPITLGTLGGISSQANGINASGEVVGNSDTSSGQQHAVIWLSGSTIAIDLNTLVALSSGDYLNYATGINDSAQIIADSSSGLAYLLTPVAVPVPGAIWLFGSGLGLLAINRRKSKHPA